MKDYWNKLAYETQALEQCHDEKILNIGAIQSCSGLIVIDSEFNIVALSENIQECLDVEIDQFLGAPYKSFTLFSNHISCEALKNIEKKKTINVYLDEIKNYDVTINIDNGHFFLEIEKSQGVVKDYSHFDSAPNVLRKIDESTSMSELYETTVEVLKDLTLFDRVMIYRFEPNGDGNVVGEKKNDDLEPWLGLRYPEGDIPPQARQAFYQSNSRMIVAVDELPVSIKTKKGVAPFDINMSKVYFRATSPFHIEYLKNMRVKATFSLPIKVEGKLWGLVTFHNYSSARHLSVVQRSTCELIGRFISSRIQTLEAKIREKLKTDIFELAQDILDRISDGKSLKEAFEKYKDRLISATDSQGFMIKIGKEKFSLGACPSRDVIEKIQNLVKQENELANWKTENSVKLGVPYHENSVGVLAVPLSLSFEDYLIWFRPAAAQTIQWGGKPKQIDINSDRPHRLSPRGSFSLWEETITDKSLEWGPKDLDAAQLLLFSFVRDIFRKASELADANKKLLEISRAKDEFLGMLSHELRTPLNIMMGWTKILKMSELDPQAKEAADIIERNANMQLSLIEDLLDISRIINGKMKMNYKSSIDLSGLVSGTIKDLEQHAKIKNIKIHFSPQQDQMTSGDPERIRQIVWNLLSNAIKYNIKDGEVFVSVTKFESSYQITVKDTGIGIKREKLPFVFDRFVQAEDGADRSSGLGLGLAIAKSLVELHGGVISVDSKGLNEGTVFSVTLPIFSININELDEEIDENEEFSIDVLRNLDVLVLEDQIEAATALKFLLEKAGATVTLEFDGKSGFNRYAERTEGQFDLIISDIGMPEWSGHDFIRQVRALEKSRQIKAVPAIALTAYATSKDRVRCIKSGFNTHLPKPVDYQELFAIVEMLDIEPKNID